MRGFPKNLNTKEDYLYVKEYFSEDLWKPQFQFLLDSLNDWFFERKLEDNEPIPSGDNYKVVEAQENDEDQRKSLYVFKENPDAKLYRLGFTKDEITNYIKRN